MEVKGIDISYCQEGMSLAKAKAAGVKFAIIRAGYRAKEDVTANAHIRGCKANKIDVGFYWYSYAKTVADAKAEAAACLEFLRKHDRPAYGVWFDAEEGNIAKVNGREVTTDIALAFISEVENAGYPCGIYANPAYLEQFYNKSRIIGKVDIWLAHWTENPAQKSRYKYGQIIWQWGLDKSINGGVDGDLCFVDMPARTAEFYKKHGTQNPEPPVIPETPAQTPSGFKVGDIVQFKGGAVYGSSDAPTASVTRGASRCKVTVTHSGKHPYHLISEDGKGVYGWVNASDVENIKTDSKPTPPAPSGGNVAIKVGDIVQFTGGAVYVSSTASTANAKRGASRCKVTTTNIKGKHPYHLASTDGKGVYGWVDSANVTK